MSQHADGDPGRWRMLFLISVAELLGMSLWFTANAIAPQLQAAWDLSGSDVGWLTTSVQLGFVAGTAVAAVLNLADVLPLKRYFAVSVLVGAGANAALVWAPGFAAALGLRFLTGFCLAGVYPPGMKMISTWFRSARGMAIGTVVGALTVGSAFPYLLKAFPVGGFAGVVLGASVGATLAAILIFVGYRTGPYPFESRPFSWSLVRDVVRHRPTRLATGGYLGHMWELYAMWVWIPAFLVASAAARAAAGAAPIDQTVLDLVAFGAIAAGGLGCVWGGLAADRIGRGKVVNLSMILSGSCALGIGFLFGAPLWVLAPVAWVWGFFIVADSAQFSAMITEVAPTHAVGTALTLQTSVGFLLTLVTIQGVPLVVDWIGWRWAFPWLVLGPVLGVASIVRFQRVTSSRAHSP